MLFAAAVHDFEHTERDINFVLHRSIAPSSTFIYFECPRTHVFYP